MREPLSSALIIKEKKKERKKEKKEGKKERKKERKKVILTH